MAKERFRSYFIEETYEKTYELFQVDKATENKFIQSLLDLLELENDCLTFSVFRLLFDIFSAEQTVFSNAQASYIYSDFSHKTCKRMRDITVFVDSEKILSRMLHGCVEGG